MVGGRTSAADFQLESLRRLVDHTWAHNPTISGWWREAGLSPAPIRRIEDLSAYPVTRKAQYQRLKVSELTSLNYRRAGLGRHVTSGSTGVPLEIHRTSLEDIVLRAFRLRLHLDFGLGWFDTRATMRTGLHAGFGGAPDRTDPLWMKLRLLRVVSVSHIKNRPAECATKLRQLGAKVLTGHADAIWRLALEVPAEQLRQIGLRYLTAGVQTVTPDMRRRIAEAFGCPLYVTYGATEFNLLASQCPKTGLFHLNEGCNYVEVLRDGRPAVDGEEGEVVATNLHVYSIPFIRYALDDWAVAGPQRCPCGAAVRTLREIQGRLSEFFYFSDGARVHPFQLINPLLEFIGWLREYRIVQTARDEVEVWYSVLQGAPPEAKASAEIHRAVSGSAPPWVTVRPVPMQAIPPGSRGKNQMFAALPKPD